MTLEVNEICFVIAPIEEPGSDVRIRSDQILKHLIRPAMERCGYATTLRADEIEAGGMITSQVLQHVTEDALVVADLTGGNPNVFYELALRHAIRKPFVQIAEKGERIPFDVHGQRTIIFDHRDLDSVDAAKKAIVEQVKSLEEKDADIETPISMSLDLQNLGQSTNPVQRSFADILSELSSIRTELFGRSMKEFESELTMQRLEANLSRIHDELLMSRGPSGRYPGTPLAAVIGAAEARPFGALEDNLPIALGYLRHEAPWLYEVGMYTYRYHVTGDHGRAQELARRTLELIEVAENSVDLGKDGQQALRLVRSLVRRLVMGLAT